MAIPNISEAGSQGPSAAAQPALLAAQPLSILPPIPAAPSTSAAASLAGRVTPPTPPYPSLEEFRANLREWLMRTDGETPDGRLNKQHVEALLLEVHKQPQKIHRIIIKAKDEIKENKSSGFLRPVGPFHLKTVPDAATMATITHAPLSFPLVTRDLTNLAVLECLGIPLSDIPECLPCRLEELELSSNALTVLSVDRLPPSLLTLNVSTNPGLANIIPDGRLSQLPNLHSLHASKSQIPAIFPYSFPVSLARLDLSHNALSAIPDGCFSSLTQIIELNLSYNALTAFPGNCLPPIAGRLSLLTLHNNRLTRLPLSLTQLPRRALIEAERNPLRQHSFLQLLNAIETERIRTNENHGPHVSFSWMSMTLETPEELEHMLKLFGHMHDEDVERWEAQIKAAENRQFSN